jgi:hypothetical protein
MNTSLNHTQERLKLYRRDRRRRASAGQTGSLVINQQSFALKATGVLPTIAEATSEAKLTSYDRNQAEQHLHVCMIAFNQCQARAGLPQFEVDPLFTTKQKREAWHAHIIKLECGIIDPRLNAQFLMTLSWDPIYGPYYWPDWCPKIMFPSEIVARELFYFNSRMNRMLVCL